jgi:NADH-quinone oxidoreductase subunit A
MKPLTNSTALWPLALYGGVVLLVVVFMLGLSHFLGQRHQEGATGESYESGILSSGNARLRFAARFYLIAVFFLIFDLEAVFIFAWAVAARELGWAGYIEIMIFIGILVAALVYLWCLGALDWGPVKRNLPATQPD